MTKRTAEPTPIEAFLARLAKICHAHPLIEGMIFWGGPDGWKPSPSEALEAEEIVFYAEGLLIDGFNMDWALVAEAGAGADGEPDHLRLCFWQEGASPPALLPGWRATDAGRWTATEMRDPG